MFFTLVSIITPVYKVEEYLDRCMESVVNQTYANLEIILVDDGSPDRCPQMCDDWAKKDKRIKVIHQENKGLSGARNTGIRESKGDWLYFLDSDDYITPECIQLMVECVNNYPNVDIVYAGCKATKGFEAFSFKNKILPDYSDDWNWINKALLQRFTLNMTAWNKLCRKDFIIEHSLFFKEGFIHEDDIWNFEMAKHVSKIAVCKHDTYIYNVREGSIMTSLPKQQQNRLVLLNYFVTHLSVPFRKRQISFIFKFIQDHFGNSIPQDFASDFTFIHNMLIKQSYGKQKIALWMCFKGPKRIIYNYHVFGRIVKAIGDI